MSTHAELLRRNDAIREEARLNHLEETSPCDRRDCDERVGRDGALCLYCVDDLATLCNAPECAEDFPAPLPDLPPEVKAVVPAPLGLGVLGEYAALCAEVRADA